MKLLRAQSTNRGQISDRLVRSNFPRKSLRKIYK